MGMNGLNTLMVCSFAASRSTFSSTSTYVEVSVGLGLHDFV